MKLHFCTTNKLVSRGIRWMFGEPASHFAMEFDDSLIIHSKFLGIGLDWKEWFMGENTMVSTLVPVTPMTLIEEEEFYQRILRKKPTRPGYDFKAFFYFAWCGLMHKYFNKPLPAKNPYNQGEHFLCTEEAHLFELIQDDMDSSITTPWKLREYFLKTGRFVEEIKKA